MQIDLTVLEEVLNSNKAIWISPDGKKLVYAKYTDTYVPTMTLPVYGQPGSMEFQYTKAVQIRYPKVSCRQNGVGKTNLSATF